MKINKIKSNKGILILKVIIVSVVLVYTIIGNKIFNDVLENDANINELGASKTLSEEEIYLRALEEKKETISFFARVFQIEEEVLLDELKTNKEGIDLENFDLSIINYLFKLEKSNKKLFSTKRTPCKDSKEYMVALIEYYTSIYPSVDFKIAAGIAQIESNYKSKGMLNCNNIFGGMAGGKLLRYKNIEYGILKYIKLLNDGYFGKGLTTVEAIGKKYNPTFNEKGVKIAKPVWVSNVKKAMEKFEETGEIDILVLNGLKNNA